MVYKRPFFSSKLFRNFGNFYFIFRHRKAPKQDENTRPTEPEQNLMPPEGTDFRDDDNSGVRARPGN